MSDLATLRVRVLAVLMDSAVAVWDNDTIDASLRLALDRYSEVLPYDHETVLSLPGDGFEVALDGLSGLLQVHSAYWPYSSTASAGNQEVNQIIYWRLWWDDARPVLELQSQAGRIPQQNEEIRVWYRTKHTIKDLDSAATTTPPEAHYSTLVTGAAGYAALSRVADRIDSVSDDPYLTTLLGTWGRSYERKFLGELKGLLSNWTRTGPTFDGPWQMDKWDRTY